MKQWLLAIPLCGVSPITHAADDDLLNQGAMLFEARCAGLCHQTPHIGRLTAKQWQVVLDTMQQRMKQNDMAPLDDHEYRAVLHYLATHAKR